MLRAAPGPTPCHPSCGTAITPAAVQYSRHPSCGTAVTPAVCGAAVQGPFPWHLSPRSHSQCRPLASCLGSTTVCSTPQLHRCGVPHLDRAPGRGAQSSLLKLVVDPATAAPPLALGPALDGGQWQRQQQQHQQGWSLQHQWRQLGSSRSGCSSSRSCCSSWLQQQRLWRRQQLAAAEAPAATAYGATAAGGFNPPECIAQPASSSTARFMQSFRGATASAHGAARCGHHGWLCRCLSPP